ncbi:hypothetical protein D3C85_378130 [compost metagenome]
MAIRATKSGWLIATKVVKETKKYYHLEDIDSKGNIYKISKEDAQTKLFDSTDEALNWIDEEC